MADSDYSQLRNEIAGCTCHTTAGPLGCYVHNRATQAMPFSIGGNVPPRLPVCPCGRGWHGPPEQCVAYLTQQVEHLKAELARRPDRPDDAFTATFTVDLDVPDPHNVQEMRAPRTADELEQWLRGLVCNQPPRGVRATVRRTGGSNGTS